MSKKSNSYEVVTRLRHDGEQKVRGDVVEIDDDGTAQTLLARGVIKLAGSKKEPYQPQPGEPDPGMEPAEMKQNNADSTKVSTGE